ncbi:MAG: threonine/serine exporter family protein [Ruminococcaceae bacterium]|nr:threonine/serine exporter family protein [Oscillospiraceae bacterium]
MIVTREEQVRLMDCMLDMGELLMDAGAEISRVEDTLSRVGATYGARRVDVFAITSLLSVTMEFPESEAMTETRRIRSNGQTDFYRVDKLNTISRRCCAEPMPIAELRAQLDAVAAGHKPFAALLAGSVLGGGSYAVFFGGTLYDALAAAFFAALICHLQYRLGRTRVNAVASNLIISLLVGLGVGLVSAVLPVLHMDKILIGDIMLLIPGLAMTNAIRNILLGDTISGVVRLTESLIWAVALAGGFMVALTIVNALH